MFPVAAARTAFEISPSISTEKVTHKIEMVSRGSEIGVNVVGKPRARKWLLTVKFDDDTEERILADGKCFTFVESGFLVAHGRYWQFYDATLKLVAALPKRRLGKCIGVANDFYSFTNSSGDYAVDNCGNQVEWLHPWAEIPAEDAFKYGMSYLREANRQAGNSKQGRGR